MLTYQYVARDPTTGEKVKSEVQADTEQAAAKQIASEGLSPIEIHLKGGGTGGLARILHRISAKDKVLFSRQLSTLINAGLPLVQSLRNVSHQTPNKSLQAVVSKVISDVEGGSNFSDALARNPHVFDQVFISLVAAGEASGTLDKSLERIANQQEKDAEIVSKVRGAMVYPFVVMAVMVGVVGFMIVAVLPQVEQVYKGIRGARLPLLTRSLLAVSHFTIKYWWVVIAVLIVMALAGTRWARTLGGKSIVDKLKMRAWPIGPLFMKLYMARFARTGSTLVASGVPLIQMLEITAKAVNNVHIQGSLNRAIDRVRGGHTLSETLKTDRNFLDLVPNMLKIGEDSGSMEQMLEKTADYFEKEVDNQIKNISTIIEPVLMIVLGVVALLIVSAVLLPIYGLVGQNLTGR